MNILVTTAVLAVLMSVSGVRHVSAFAQTDISENETALPSSPQVAKVYVATRSAAFDITEPANNLTVTPVYQTLIDRMLARSPTFRRQWARLAAARHLSVLIRSEGPPSDRAGALTQIQQRGGRMDAVVQVGLSRRSAELIAHELEHVIEQLDGIDLHVKSLLPASGVRRVWDLGAYETTRAIATGLRVAREAQERNP
jgi:hypothetical protein